MIVVLDEAAGLGLRRVRWRDRVAGAGPGIGARPRAGRRGLARIERPLAVHAGRLCEPTERQLLAAA